MQTEAFERDSGRNPLPAGSVSVVFPCLNEEGAVGSCVRRAHEALSAASLEGEVIVVDNGSADSSPMRQVVTQSGLAPSWWILSSVSNSSG